VYLGALENGERETQFVAAAGERLPIGE
jgi:hypothetical protein